MLNWQAVYSRVLTEVRRERMLATTVRLHEHNARMSFSAYAAGSRWLAAALGELGLDASDGSYPADGRTQIGGRVLPLAWDVEDAELYVVEPGGDASLLASFR
ncbi:MAG: hypothetical protein FJ279_35485, partial [Planctomycetes bacterium]|nr:hypothetical protein [Planctomycetota bacterium]